LVAYFSKYKNDLSEDSKIRLEKNPLRILDSKDEGDKKLCVNAPKLTDSLNESSKTHFAEVTNLLIANSQKLIANSQKLIANPNLVRGLDYYNHTVFEFKSSSLGAQDTILAGGRYDGLVAQMGGSPTPAVGWGAGIERLMLLSEIAPKPREVTVVILEDKAQALSVAQALRAQGKIVEIAQATNEDKAFKKAKSSGATYIIKREGGNLIQKNLNTGEQTEISL
jgi:histidyl-tRNA synthetase